MLDFDPRAQLDFYRWVAAGGVVVHAVPPVPTGRTSDLEERTPHTPIDLREHSLVVAAEPPGVRAIVSIDRDFEICRIGGRSSFEVLYPTTK